MFEMIAFDADDTLWHSENQFAAAQKQYRRLLARYHSPEWVDQKLYETEMRNLKLYGYGSKGFALSLIETAIQLTEGRISGHEIGTILHFVREMMETPNQPLDGVIEILDELSQQYPLMLITKGDLMEQESKIAGSGLADYFMHIEIVSAKSTDVYRQLFDRHQIDAKRLLMIGNSLPSDVLPIVELGGIGVHIPYQITWKHERVQVADAHLHGYHTLQSIRDVPALVRTLVHGIQG